MKTKILRTKISRIMIITKYFARLENTFSGNNGKEGINYDKLCLYDKSA